MDVAPITHSMGIRALIYYSRHRKISSSHQLPFICSSSIFRLLSYLFISYLYFTHMKSRAPLGLSALDFQVERVYNSCINILSNWPFVRIGLSSWHVGTIDSTRHYFVQAISYLQYLPFAANGKDGIKAAISIIDPVTVAFTSLFASEIYYRLIGRLNKHTQNLSAVACFTIFVSSIYSYRMSIAMWHDVLFLMWASLATLLAIYKRKYSSYICFSIASLNQYHWAALYYLLILPAAYLCRNYTSSSLKYLLPPSTRRHSNLILLAPGLLTIAALTVQKLYLFLHGIESSNSTALYRIGIDSAKNIHHGGLLGALQFLGGIRISLCLAPSLGIETLNNIFMFNCFLAIGGSVTINIIAIYGYCLICKNVKSARWYCVPVSFMLLATYSILQQSTAAHLQGRSFLFNIIIGFGIPYLMLTFVKFKSRIGLFIQCAISVCLTLAIVFNSIRLSFLLGPNG